MALVASSPDIHSIGQVGMASVDTGVLFLISFLLLPICRRLLRRSLSLLALEAWAFLWSLAIGAAASTLVDVFLFPGRSLALRLFDIFQYALALFLWCSLYFSITHWRRALQAQSEARVARLDALRYQLNPHFLFNSLNAVSTLMIEEDGAAATRMLSQISDYLRTLLD